MATRYKIATAGNWADATKWSDVSTSDAGPASDYPKAGDTVIMDAVSGNVTLGAAAACALLNQTGYLANFGFGANILTVTGNVTRGGTSTFTGNGGITVTGTSTITGNGTAFGETLRLEGAYTRTINSQGSIWGTLVPSNAAAAIVLQSPLQVGVYFPANNYGGQTFTGVFDLHFGVCNLAHCSTTLALTIPAGQTLTIDTFLKAIPNSSLSGMAAYGYIQSGTAPSAAYLIYNGNPENCAIAHLKWTDMVVTAPNCGGVLDNWYGGTLLRVNNSEFTVTAANATAGATYTHNGQTYTVDATIAGTTTLKTTCQVRPFPYNAGVLTKASGTGDSTITFSAVTLQGIQNITSADVARLTDAHNISAGRTVGNVSGTCVQRTRRGLALGVY
jgi:hypothetical protein